MTPRILVFSGSARVDSYNKKLARLGAAAVDAAGGQATFIDLRDHPLPIYDGDLEDAQGIPPPALELKRLFREHHGLMIASPENNASVPALLKNTIDWISRATPTESGRAPYEGKVVAMLAATTGNLGGTRMLPHLRQILSALGCLVLPDQFGLSQADAAFDGDARLREPRHQAGLDAVARRVVAVAARLHAA
jgi:NAD(P)H-dependent FMN reductase